MVVLGIWYPSIFERNLEHLITQRAFGETGIGPFPVPDKMLSSHSHQGAVAIASIYFEGLGLKILSTQPSSLELHQGVVVCMRL